MPDEWMLSTLPSDFNIASTESCFTVIHKSPTWSLCTIAPEEWFDASLEFTLESMIWRIAETALKIETSVNRLWSKKAFLSLTTLSSSVLQGRLASIAKSVAHGRRSCLPSLPWPPPLPPQFSFSDGRDGKLEGFSAIDGGTNHVFARNPYGRLPNWKWIMIQQELRDLHPTELIYTRKNIITKEYYLIVFYKSFH